MALSAQSDRNSVDFESADREYAELSNLYKTTAFGLCFSGQKIYFAEVHHKDGFEVRKMGSIATNLKFGSGIEGVERNIQSLYSYVNGCLEDNDIKAKRMNISINTNLALISKVFVENDVSEDDLENFVKWEFSQQALDDVDQYVVNTVSLDSFVPQKNLSPILAVGLRRRYVESLTTILEKSKITFSNLDVDLLCTHATYEVNYDISYAGMTALVEVKNGSISILLCKDYEVEYFYQFTCNPKSTPQKIGELLNRHLENMMRGYQNEIGNKNAVLGRVILSNLLAKEVMPFVEEQFSASVIDPFRKILLPKDLRPVEEEPELDENGVPKKKIEIPKQDYTPYAECIGAALKLLLD